MAERRRPRAYRHPRAQLRPRRPFVIPERSEGANPESVPLARQNRSPLRTLLIQGARSSLNRAKAVATDKATPEQLWIRSLAVRMPFGKVIVAIANKHARQLWAMLALDVDYDPAAFLNHPLQHHAT